MGHEPADRSNEWIRPQHQGGAGAREAAKGEDGIVYAVVTCAAAHDALAAAGERARVRCSLAQALGRLGPLSCTRCRACTCGPCYPVVCRGPYSLWGMGGVILGGASRLDAVSASPCRAWLPGDAPGGTTRAPAARPPRSSRTGGGAPQTSNRPRRIETELSHDVLNPARVPL